MFQPHTPESIGPDLIRDYINSATEILDSISLGGDPETKNEDELWASITPNAVFLAYDELNTAISHLTEARHELVQQLATKPWIEG